MGVGSRASSTGVGASTRPHHLHRLHRPTALVTMLVTMVLLHCCLLALVPTAHAATLLPTVYVAVDGSDSPTCGGVGAACRSLNHSMFRLAPGSPEQPSELVLQLAPDAATAPAPDPMTGFDFDINQTITLGGAAGAWQYTTVTAAPALPRKPVLRCREQVRAFDITGGNTTMGPPVVVSGLRIVGCGPDVTQPGAVGAGVAFVSGQPVPALRTVAKFVDCEFDGNRGATGGVVDVTGVSHVAFEGCVFTNNWATVSGGVAAVSNAAEVDFEGCTFGAGDRAQYRCPPLSDDNFPPRIQDACNASQTVVLGLVNGTGHLYHAGGDAGSSGFCKWHLEGEPGQGLRLDFCDLASRTQFLIQNCEEGVLLTATDPVTGIQLYSGCGLALPIVSTSHRIDLELSIGSNSIYDFSFSAQFAPTSGNAVVGASATGGAIAAADSTIVRVHNVTVVASAAGAGGAGFARLQGNSTFLAVGSDDTFRATHCSASAGSGGVLHLSDNATAVLESVTLSESLAYYGGIIGLDGSNTTLQLSHNSTLSRGVAWSGGAISAVAGSVITASDAVVSDSQCNNDGGGVWLSGEARARFENCSFTSNAATQENQLGGGLAVDTNTVTDFVRCDFRSNLGQWGGGFHLTDNAVVTSEGGTFYDNEAIRTGAVLHVAGSATYRDEGGVYSNNHGSRGAVLGLWQHDYSPASVHFRGSRIVNNWAASQGGFVYMQVGVLYLDNCTVADNSALGLNGATISVSAYGTTVHAVDTVFRANSVLVGAGAVLYVRALRTGDDRVNLYTFTRCVIADNSGMGMRTGGAMSLEGTRGGVARLEMVNSTVTGNRGVAAAVIFLDSNIDFNATDTVFDGNIATHGSTAIIAQADEADKTVHVTLERCTFRNHDAGTYDAGVMALNEFVVLNSYNCTFEDNTAGNGGVIYATLPAPPGTLRINLVDTVFRNNVASKLGGAISVSVGEGPSVVLLSQGSFFYNNSAVGGGAISATGPAVVELLETHFIGNQADDDGGAVAVQSGTSLLMDGCWVSDNYATTGGGINALASSSVTTSGCTFETNGARGWGGGGVVYVARSSSVVATNCTYRKNRAGVGAVFNSVLASHIAATACTFVDNVATASGAVLYSTSTGPYSFVDSTLLRNSAVSGGAMMLQQDSAVSLTRCNVSWNTASFGGVVFGTNSASVSVIDSVFAYNSGSQEGGNVIAQSEFKFHAEGSTFVGAAAAEHGAVIDASGSSMIDFVDCTITDSSAEQGGVAYVHQDSHFGISNCYVARNRAEAAGGAFAFMGTSHVHVVNVVLVDNVADASGGAMFASTGADVTIKNATLIGNSAASGGGLMAGGQSVVSMYNSTLLHNKASLAGGAVAVADEVHVLLSGCTLEGNTAVQGGAVDAQGTGDSAIVSCTARGNRATFGGVVSLSTQVHLHVNDSHVANNIAAWGGVAHVQGPFLPELLYDHLWMSRDTIVNNSALEAGGVLYWTMTSPGTDLSVATSLASLHGIVIPRVADFGFLDTATCTLERNSAMAYGQVSAGNPVLLEVLQNSSASYSSALPASATSPSVSPSPQPAVAQQIIHSGETVTPALVVVSVDALGQHNTGASHELLVRASVNMDDLAYVVYGQTLADGPTGTVRFASLTAQGYPGTDMAIAFSSLEPVGLRAAELTFAIGECRTGQVQRETICQDCEEGTYNWGGDRCVDCPVHAVCPGGALVVAENNFWRTNYNSTKLAKCPNAEACLGAERYRPASLAMERCAEGYTSNLCGACQAGWGHPDRLTCSPCLDNSTNVIILIVVVLVAALVTAVVVQIQRHIGEKGMDVMTMVVKILASYYQFVSVANSLDVFWPPAIRRLFEAQNSVTSVGGRLMFLECLLRDGSDRSVFYEKTLMWILIAPFAVVVAALFWSLAVLYRNTCRRRWGHERRPLVELIRICKTNFIVTCIVLVFLLHPSVSAKVLEMVTCVEIVPNTGEYFLQSALELQCYTREHILWVVCAALPAFVFIVAGVPVLCYVLLRRMSQQLDDSFVQEKYGFLYLGYTPQCYYWEIVIVARKVAIIVATELLAQLGFLVQILGALWVTFFAYLVHEAAKPYSNPKLDRLDRVSLLISLGTFGLGAFLRAEPLISEDEPDRATTWAAAVIAGIIILANVGFLLGTAIYVRNEILSMMKDTVSDIRGVLGCICRCCRGCRNKDAQEEGYKQGGSPPDSVTEDSVVYWNGRKKKPRKSRRPTSLQMSAGTNGGGGSGGHRPTASSGGVGMGAGAGATPPGSPSEQSQSARGFISNPVLVSNTHHKHSPPQLASRVAARVRSTGAKR